MSSCLLFFFPSSVFKAVNIPEHRVAACKFIALTEQTTETERKTVEKEMRVHAALKHEHVLEFLNAVVVDLKHKQTYIPGIYMLLEFAGGGDLFDKIGMLTCYLSERNVSFFHLPKQLPM
jgi:serine/threonine-protein kinase Chk1